MAGDYCNNVYDGVFTGETREIKHIDPASVGPNDPRPEMVKPTRFARGQASTNPPGTPIYP